MSDFQKRHYQAIAAIVADVRGISQLVCGNNGSAAIACDDLSGKLADYFAADNPNFNRDTFAKACRGEDYRGKRRAAA